MNNLALRSGLPDKENEPLRPRARTLNSELVVRPSFVSLVALFLAQTKEEQGRYIQNIVLTTFRSFIGHKLFTTWHMEGICR
jgi:hypothetical protein